METLKPSLFGKKCEVIQRMSGSEPCEWMVRCNHCGNIVRYGDTYLVSGIMCCERCREYLHNEIENDKKLNYEIYEKKDYELFGVENEKK